MAEHLELADSLLLHFPLWLHAQPAMLKGSFDSVFAYVGVYFSTARSDNTSPFASWIGVAPFIHLFGSWVRLFGCCAFMSGIVVI